MHRLIFLISFLSITSCSLFNKAKKIEVPESLGEQNSGYSYIPLDPLPIIEGFGKDCDFLSDRPNFKEYLESFPDQSVRLAVGEYDRTGSINFGPATVGYQERTYQVILDYISVDSRQLPIFIEKNGIINGENKGKISLYETLDLEKKSGKDVKYRYKVNPAPRFSQSYLDDDFISEQYFDTLNYDKGDLVVIPTYIGIGLRLTATVYVQSGSVNLSSLGALAAEAQAGKLTGTLTIQTLGISGRNVSSALPLPSEINTTTIQNAILALGSIKALLYDSTTVITPRIVGIYNSVGGGQQLVNGVISVLSQDPLVWDRPCKPAPENN